MSYQRIPMKCNQIQHFAILEFLNNSGSSLEKMGNLKKIGKVKKVNRLYISL